MKSFYVLYNQGGSEKNVHKKRRELLGYELLDLHWFKSGICGVILSFRGSETTEESRKSLKIFLDSSLRSEWQE